MRISVIFTGGTIGSVEGKDGFFSVDKTCKFRLLSMYRQQKRARNAEFVAVEPYQTLSEYVNGEYLSKLIACVKEEAIKPCDGIIVAHGTDTLQYTAAALGYAMGNGTKPIVIVSSNYVLEDARMNGLENFTAAVDFIAAEGGKGVFVAYQNEGEATTIHRATRLCEHQPYADQLYSIQQQYFGIMENGLLRKNTDYRELEDCQEPLARIWSGEQGGVLWLHPSPGFDWENVGMQCRAILLSTFHSGTLNTKNEEWKRFILRANEKKIPVFLVGVEGQTAYESKREFSMLGIHLLPKISPIAAYIKLGMLLASSNDLVEYCQKSLGGDLLV